MRKLNSNFSSLQQRQRQSRQVLMLVLLALVLAFVCSEWLTVKEQLSSQSITQQNDSTTTQPRVSRAVQHQLEKLRDVISALNVPWAELFLAIEQVKQNHPEVLLTRVEPNLKKGEVTMRGQVEQLEQLLRFIDELNQQQIFSQTLLLSQQLVSEEDEQMVFDLKLRWLLNE